MNLTHLHYALYALDLLVNKRPIENFVFQKALNGMLDFLESDDLDDEYRRLINENIGVFYGAKNILKTYLDGGSCIHEIIELNYLDFKKLIDEINNI